MSLHHSVSKLCFGCEPLGGTDWGNYSISDVEDAVSRALELGVNFFDTAGVYGLGLSEKRLSKVLGPKRHDIFVATKGGLRWSESRSRRRATITKDSSREAIKRNIEQSLTNLRVDSLKVFYVHWPDNATPFESTFEYLRECQDRQLIESIGVSNFPLNNLIETLEFCTIDVVQIPGNILDTSRLELFKQICAVEDISIVTYNSLASGLLSGKYDRMSQFPESDRRSRQSGFSGVALRENLERVDTLGLLAKELGMSLPQYAIKSLQDLSNVRSTIVGIKNIKQIEEFSQLI